MNLLYFIRYINILVYLLLYGIFIIMFALKKSRNVFHTLQSLYVHFTQLTRNKNLIDIQNRLGLTRIF